MVRPHNPEGIIEGISHFEKQFRIGYKMIHGSTKGATRAYKRALAIGPKKARRADRQHDFNVLTQCSHELEIQLMFEGEGK